MTNVFVSNGLNVYVNNHVLEDFGFDQGEQAPGGRDSFVSQTVIPEKWRENFRMSRGSLYILADDLKPYIESQTTKFRVPVDVVKQVAGL